VRKRDYLDDTDLDGRLILKWILKRWDWAQAGLIWLRIETDGELVIMRY